MTFINRFKHRFLLTIAFVLSQFSVAAYAGLIEPIPTQSGEFYRLGRVECCSGEFVVSSFHSDGLSKVGKHQDFVDDRDLDRDGYQIFDLAALGGSVVSASIELDLTVIGRGEAQSRPGFVFTVQFLPDASPLASLAEGRIDPDFMLDYIGISDQWTGRVLTSVDLGSDRYTVPVPAEYLDLFDQGGGSFGLYYSVSIERNGAVGEVDVLFDSSPTLVLEVVAASVDLPGTNVLLILGLSAVFASRRRNGIKGAEPLKH